MIVRYWNHGGRHQVAVVLCPRICGNRLVHLSQDSETSWALRDFITGQMIRRTPRPSTATSHRTLAEIEAEVTHCEEPRFMPVSERAEWKRELESKTHRMFRGEIDRCECNPAFGDWRPLR